MKTTNPPQVKHNTNSNGQSEQVDNLLYHNKKEASMNAKSSGLLIKEIGRKTSYSLEPVNLGKDLGIKGMIKSLGHLTPESGEGIVYSINRQRRDEPIDEVRCHSGDLVLFKLVKKRPRNLSAG